MASQARAFCGRRLCSSERHRRASFAVGRASNGREEPVGRPRFSQEISRASSPAFSSLLSIKRYDLLFPFFRIYVKIMKILISTLLYGAVITVEEIENLLHESLLLSFNTEIEDGSIEEVPFLKKCRRLIYLCVD